MVINRQLVKATSVVTLGKISDFVDGEWVVQLSGTFVVSSIPKAIAGPSTAAGQTLAQADFVNVAYTPLKTGVLTDGAVTPITVLGLYTIRVPAGCTAYLDCTYTSGTMVVDAAPSLKAA